MAAARVSPATVQRIWWARKLQPHRVCALKLATDPRLEKNLVDVVGRHTDPPGESGRAAAPSRFALSFSSYSRARVVTIDKQPSRAQSADAPRAPIRVSNCAAYAGRTPHREGLSGSHHCC
jgi:hypothetical protein